MSLGFLHDAFQLHAFAMQRQIRQLLIMDPKEYRGEKTCVLSKALERMRAVTKTNCHYNRTVDRDSKAKPHEYQAGTLNARP